MPLSEADAVEALVALGWSRSELRRLGGEVDALMQIPHPPPPPLDSICGERDCQRCLLFCVGGVQICEENLERTP